MIRNGSVAAAIPTPRVERAGSAHGGHARRAPQLQILLAEAIRADRQLNLSLCALVQALQTAQTRGDAMRLPSDIDQWLRERATLRPLLHESTRPAAARPLAEVLTRKESQVLELLARGYSNDGMARQLFISESTVRTHLRSINHKLCAGSRTQAIAIARKLGFVD